MLTLAGTAGLAARVGRELGVSGWYTITQEAIDAFAAATGDHEELHTSPERAATTAWGVTIAHGLFMLSLGPRFLYEIYQFDGDSLRLNYGFDRVRFVTPVPVGSRLRMRLDLIAVEPIRGGLKARMRQTFEIEGQDKPACVAESLVVYYD
jgi:acyl dehydratase